MYTIYTCALYSRVRQFAITVYRVWPSSVDVVTVAGERAWVERAGGDFGREFQYYIVYTSEGRRRR